MARLRGQTGRRKRRTAFLDDYPVTLTGPDPMRPGQRAERQLLVVNAPSLRPQSLSTKPAPGPMPPPRLFALPPPRATGLFATIGVCPVHGAHTCGRCGDWRRDVMHCCTLRHEGHGAIGMGVGPQGHSATRPCCCIFAPTPKSGHAHMVQPNQPPQGATNRGASSAAGRPSKQNTHRNPRPRPTKTARRLAGSVAGHRRQPANLRGQR